MTQRSFNLIRTLIQLSTVTGVMRIVEISQSLGKGLHIAVYVCILTALIWTLSVEQYRNIVQHILIRIDDPNLSPESLFANIASDSDFLNFLRTESVKHGPFCTAKSYIIAFGLGIIPIILHNATIPILRLFGNIIVLLCLTVCATTWIIGFYCDQQSTRYLTGKAVKYYRQTIKTTLDSKIDKR